MKFKTQETRIALPKAKAEARERTAILWIFAGAFLLVLTALVFFAAWSRIRRRQLEQRHEMERTGRYLEGLEEERTRLACELHDGACNDLLGIGLSLNSSDFDRADVGARIARLRDSLRRMSHEQMPPEFRYADIDEILRDYISHVPLPQGLRIDYSSEGSDWQSVPHAVAYQYYRIVQEAIGNIIRHSGATQTSVGLIYDSRVLRLRVSDNGRGLGPDASEGALKSIRERAAGIGADFSKTDPGKGFCIEISYGKP